MKYIAICNNIQEFNSNRILDKQWAKRFPGASWVPFFNELVNAKGFKVITGDIALSHVINNYWDTKDILVMQELNARSAKRLIKLGATPWILTGFESPLIAWDFYDRLKDVASIFQNRVLFSGAFKSFDSRSGNNYPIKFMNYFTEHIREPLLWDRRKFLVMVAVNKHWKNKITLPIYNNLEEYRVWSKSRLVDIYKLFSKTRRSAIKNELYTKRLSAIEYFGSLKKICLFGHNWNRLEILPHKWRIRLENIIKNLAVVPCEDKIETISKFKYALCFENVVYEGYVTEKIIDCFVAGVIPIYLGAPNIEKYIPEEAFIDMRKFDSWHELDSYLENLKEKEAYEIIRAGRAFLSSEKGKLYSFEGFANFIKGLL